MFGRTGQLLCGVSLFASSACFAQTTPAASPAPQAAATEPAQGVQDIVVTAQRREQRLQDVPIAVAAVTATAMQNAQVRNVIDLPALTPALVINRYGNATVAFIRGVGSLDGTPGQEGAVAVYVDGVYHAAPFTSGLDFNNIARVEVLKGPQGTLFGRNATGGAIQIITADPTDTPTATGSLSYGNFRTVDGRLYASTGLGKNLAGDIAITYHDQGEGYGRNLTTGKDVYKERNFSARSKLVWEPNDRAKITLTGQYYELRNSWDARKPTKDSTLLDGSTYASTGGFYDVRNDIDTFFHVRGEEVSGRISYEFDPFSVVSITAFQHAKSYSTFDQDGTPLSIVGVNIEGRFRTFTQELQLLSPSTSRIKWIVGGFFMKDRSGFGGENGINLYGSGVTGGSIGIVAPIRTTSYSVFAEGTVPLGESTRLTLGGRYSRDERRLSSHINILDGPAGAVLARIDNQSQSANFSKPTWRAILDHRFDPNVMVYASVSRGFKSGNFNAVSPTDPAFRPEVLTAYEIGLKSDLLGRRLRLNLSSYYYRYSNMQLAIVVGSTSQTMNAGKAELAGAELELDAVLGGGFSISASGAYAYSRFLRYDGGVCFTPLAIGGDSTTTCSHTGERLPKSPKLTFTISPSYKIDTSIGKFTANASWYHTSRYRWEPSGSVYQNSYDLVSARIGWTEPGGRFGLAAFAKNLLSEKYALYAFGQALGDQMAAAPPRMYGIEANFHF